MHAEAGVTGETLRAAAADFANQLRALTDLVHAGFCSYGLETPPFADDELRQLDEVITDVTARFAQIDLTDRPNMASTARWCTMLRYHHLWRPTMQRLSLVLLASLAASTPGCSGNPPSTGGCGGNSECSSGEICDQGSCLTLCANDMQCGAGLVCENDICVAGGRVIPVITAVDGDGTMTCPDANGTHCLAAGMIINGDNLAGASFSLTPQSGTPVELVVRDSMETVATVDLPDLAPGDYTLVATNQAGSDQASLTLLQGPPGPDLTANELVTLLNTASSKLLSSVLPVGATASDVAAGDHGHGAGDITGTFPVASLPVGSTASTVSAGDHGHAGYLADADNSVAANHVSSGIIDFAHLAATSAVVRAKMGTYGYQAGARVVTLGWEPDFVIISRQGTHATMVGYNDGLTGGRTLYALWASGGVGGAGGYIQFNTDGFQLNGNDWHNQSGYTHRYLALQFKK